MPKVIDLPTSTSMSDSDYLIMESSGGGTKKITRSNVEKRSTVQNLVTRTSGATLNSSALTYSGKLATINVSLTTTAQTTPGNDLFEGTYPSEYTPPLNAMGIGYLGSAIIIGNFRSNGTIVFHVVGANVAANANISINCTYLMR